MIATLKTVSEKRNDVTKLDTTDNCRDEDLQAAEKGPRTENDCSKYNPISIGIIWCDHWYVHGYSRMLMQLQAIGAPKEVSEPAKIANEEDSKCYDQAIADGASGWKPAYSCPAADKLYPQAKANYLKYVSAHPLPWKTQKEECSALKTFIETNRTVIPAIKHN